MYLHSCIFMHFTWHCTHVYPGGVQTGSCMCFSTFSSLMSEIEVFLLCMFANLVGDDAFNS